MNDSRKASKGSVRRDKLFLSYCPEDGEKAEKIVRILQHLDYEVYSNEALEPGDSRFAIYENIKDFDLAIILLSQNYVNSRLARREMDVILERSLTLNMMRVVPLLIPKECEIPALLSPIINIDMRVDFEGGLIKLLEFLRRHFGRA